MKTIISEMPKWRNWYRARYGIAIGYPCIAHGAIMTLERLSDPTFKVLEIGCGGSTIFFSRRFGEVKSLDDDPFWIEQVRKALPEKHNVTLICEPLDVLKRIILNEPDEFYDIVFYDIGNTGKIRGYFVNDYNKKVKIGGYLVIDNYENKLKKEYDYTGFDVFTYDELPWHTRGTRICIRRE